ncbi:MAG TPA: hypothetical protein VJL89_14225 [Thermodesulfovibrionia bacterium]|nr:hypothetical protein [Thermodesulfovibrionia bacterium]
MIKLINKKAVNIMSAMSMSEVIVDKKYIENLPFAPDKQLTPVRGDQFFDALEKAYTLEKVRKAVQWVFDQPKEHQGFNAYKERIIECMDSRNTISVDDQKYMAHLVQRAAAGQMYATKI